MNGRHQQARSSPMADIMEIPLVVNSAVVSKRMKDGAVLVHSGTGACFELNRIGAEIWTELERGTAPAAIADGLAARHGISTDSALADVRQLLGELSRQGLLKAGG